MCRVLKRFLYACACGNSGESVSVRWFYRRRWRSVRGERRGTRYVYDVDIAHRTPSVFAVVLISFSIDVVSKFCERFVLLQVFGALSFSLRVSLGIFFCVSYKYFSGRKYASGMLPVDSLKSGTFGGKKIRVLYWIVYTSDVLRKWSVLCVNLTGFPICLRVFSNGGTRCH